MCVYCMGVCQIMCVKAIMYLWTKVNTEQTHGSHVEPLCILC